MRVCAGCANRNEATALTEVPDPCEGRFDTLAGAIAHIDHILRFPDLLLI